MQHRTAAIVAASLVFVVFFAVSVDAQQETPTAQEDQYAPGPDAECPGAEVVQTTTGTGNKQTAPFRITGDRFRITTAATPTPDSPTDAIFVGIIVRRENGGIVSTFSQDQPGTDSSIVNAGPGAFFLDITSANARYTVVVEDCPGTAGDEEQPPELEEPPPDEEILNIPRKPLPDTGGPPLLLVGAALLSLAGAVVTVRILKP